MTASSSIGHTGNAAPAPRLLRLLGLAFLAPLVLAKQIPPAVTLSPDGRLAYVASPAGDRVPDFSSAGYGGGGVSLPVVPDRVPVLPVAGNATARIQAALDHVATLAPDAAGLRGAVALAPGRYDISGQLRLTVSGVILRGADSVLVATGTDRRALILVRGKPGRAASSSRPIADAYVPVGATSLHLADTAGLAVGTRLVLSRPATAEWIAALGMDLSPGRQQFAWKPAAMALTWDRTVVAVDGPRLKLDAPLTTSLDAKFSRATVALLLPGDELTSVGVENLRLESAFDAANPLDEQHAWEGVSLDCVRDVWVAGVTFAHFAGSAVNVGAGARRVTVQDCVSLAPVSELGGYRRHTFHTSGQQTLFLRCRAEDGRNDFTVGYRAAGPNVFLECSALRSTGFSGSVGSWASGVLFDRVTHDGGTLALDHRETWNQGVGWAAANSMLWQCSAPVVICRAPPTAQNWADGVWGQFVGDGAWSRVNEFPRPDSLYRAQLADRLGAKSLAALAPLPAEDAAPSAPVFVFTEKTSPSAPQKPLALVNSLLTAEGALLTGGEAAISWWRGYLSPESEPTKPALTRFSPGLAGPIHTDDLAALADGMAAAHEVVLRHHYGLWYDRRRMDHERMRRPDAEVWPPFYEQPFARSGRGAAWDGLSRYDLTKFNPWYFGRLREFAGLARARGLVLVDEMYFQHNILEAGAHWVDSPWRGVNNVNGTGFTEPPPFTGDTVKMAAEFYDLTAPSRRALHRGYIRQCLVNLADEPNVLHTLAAENSGPLHFMRFWLDVVDEWRRETGRHPLLALSACKDVQDAILADPVRSTLIDVIDLTYWWRTEDGAEFAPAGGTDLAPRQHDRKWKGGRPSAVALARMAAEYRAKFPGKAVITGLDPGDGWAFAAAGGSLPKLPATTDARLLAALARLTPLGAPDPRATSWTLGETDRQFFGYAARGGDLAFDLTAASGEFVVHRIALADGSLAAATETVTAGKLLLFPSPAGRPAAIWLVRP